MKSLSQTRFVSKKFLWPEPQLQTDPCFPQGGYFKHHHISLGGTDKTGQIFWTIEERHKVARATGTEFLNDDAMVMSITQDSLKLKWTSFILKNQRQMGGNEKISYIPQIGSKYIHYAYSTGEGIASKLALTYINRANGQTFTRDLYFGNANGTDPLINKSCALSTNRILLMGVGRSKKSEYTLINIYDLP